MPAEGEITRMLGELNSSGREALDGLFPLVYEELHRLAHHQLRAERSDHTIGPTALVHEAYLKLSGLERIQWQNRAHFMAVAAQAMRRVLINYAAARNAQKRGGTWARLSLDDVIVLADDRVGDLLALDEALTRLALVDERQARVVECRFFAGMSVDETSEALGVAPATVKRDWTCARAWLNRELDAGA